MRSIYTILVGLILAAVVGHPTLVQAGQYGTAAEARAMLEKAVAAVKSDKAAALEAFNAGAAGFRDRDLYPFCAGVADGIVTAHPMLKGKQIRDLKDKNGFAFGEQIMKVAVEEGKIEEVAYLWPRPNSDTPVPKVSFVTKVGDQVCAVGYYK